MELGAAGGVREDGLVAVERAGGGSGEGEGQIEELDCLDAGTRLPMEHGEGDVGLVFAQGHFQLRIAELAQRQTQGRDLALEGLQDLGEVIAEGRGRGGEAEMGVFLAAEAGRDLLDAREERLDEIIELLAGGRQGEGAALEELHPEILFQRRDLTTHGRLLDPVGHLADGLGDALVFGYVIVELEMVNVHSGVGGRTAKRTKAPRKRKKLHLREFHLSVIRSAPVRRSRRGSRC